MDKNVPFVPYNLSDVITIKVAESDEEKHKAFELLYQVYVEELGAVNPDKLTAKERQERRKFDQYDQLDTTIHIVALDEKKDCIGHARLVDGDLPLEEHYVMPKKEKNNGIVEVSKLAIRRNYRASGISIALFQYIYYLSAHLDFLYYSIPTVLEKYYRKIGFQRVSEFFHPIYERKDYVLRLDMRDIEAHADKREGVDPQLCELIKDALRILPQSGSRKALEATKDF